MAVQVEWNGQRSQVVEKRPAAQCNVNRTPAFDVSHLETVSDGGGVPVSVEQTSGLSRGQESALWANAHNSNKKPKHDQRRDKETEDGEIER